MADSEAWAASGSLICGGLQIPLYPQIVNLGLAAFGPLAAQIDSLPAASREWDKVGVLLGNLDYLHFLSALSGSGIAEAALALSDFVRDGQFRSEMEESLNALSDMENVGDLRFHALSLYVLVRLLRPDVVVETGVAHGKSSAFLLLALHHNGKGELTSVDLPPDGPISDGSLTTLHGRSPGWIVPSYLKGRWRLLLGDSRQVLPSVVDGLRSQERNIDVFIHDSLHTYDHTAFEISFARQVSGTTQLVCVDNIDMGSGEAFSQLVHEVGGVGYAFRDFAAVNCREAGSRVQ